MNRFEEFKKDVGECSSPTELTALIIAVTSTVCITNVQEGRCDKMCGKTSQQCCLQGMQEYFESESPTEIK
jgi:hypothetical protein